MHNNTDIINPLLSIIVPVYNEEKNITQAFSRLFQVVDKELNLKNNWLIQIIIVDDGSTDNSVDLVKNFVAKKANVIFLKHKCNKGKGAAISTALKQARGKFCIIQDADLEYDPSDIISLVKPLIENKYDVVYGSRFLKLQRYNGLWSNLLGNKVLSLSASFLLQRRITDMMTCYKAFRRNLLDNVISRSFDVEPEITAKLLSNRNIRYKELSVNYNPRIKGKKIKKIDGFISLIRLIKVILVIQKEEIVRGKSKTKNRGNSTKEQK